MNRFPRAGLFLVAVLLLAGAVPLVKTLLGDPPPPLPDDVLSRTVELVYARPFVLDQPYTHFFRAEQPAVASGYVLVIAADPAVIHPRQTYEPVLYVGDETAERVNFGHESGHVIAFVPAGLDADGQVDLDLASTPIYFGEPALPEQVTREQARAQLERAVERGIRAQPLANVLGRTEGVLRFADDGDLRLWASDLIERYSPQEVDLVSGLRAPRVGR